MSDVEPTEPSEPNEPSLIDKMRGTGVGVEDENIVGDVGPTDVAPGADPDGSGSDDPLFEQGDDPGEV